ncbi:MAG TPA: hypothetical protein VGN72_15920 [Tepidisphaeraceae bacterium]|nr:hypothetical protein [Tepidisphaeraceae bacterium]
MAEQRERIDENLGQIGAGGGGSNDVDSGGGAGAGIPDAETVMRAGDAVTRGDVTEDRKRIFGKDADNAGAQPGQDKH